MAAALAGGATGAARGPDLHRSSPHARVASGTGMEQNGDIHHLKDPLLPPPAAYSASPAAALASPRKERKTRKVMFSVRGISCASCAVSIETVVAGLKGVESIQVSTIQGQAVVQYRPEETDTRTIKEAIEDLNFEVDELQEQEIAVCRLRIKGMACTSCSESIERALQMTVHGSEIGTISTQTAI